MSTNPVGTAMTCGRRPSSDIRSPTSDTLRTMIIAEARTWIGTPWKHQGCAKGRAADCLGLVTGVARGLGLACGRIDAEAYRGYPRLPNPPGSPNLGRSLIYRSCTSTLSIVPSNSKGRRS